MPMPMGQNRRQVALGAPDPSKPSGSIRRLAVADRQPHPQRRSTMSNTCDFEIIVPPDTLRQKIVRGSGPDLATISERFEAALESLKQMYPERLLAEMALVKQALAAAMAHSGPERAEAVQRIYHLSKEMTGQATTFDYLLITIIGRSLCAFIDEAETIGAAELRAIDAHVKAVTAVITAKATGNGGELGKQLVASLNVLGAKILREE